MMLLKRKNTILKKLLASLAAAMIAVSCAFAEGRLVDELTEDNLAGMNLSARLGITLAAHMPYDDQRTGELQLLLDHVALGLTIRQNYDNSWCQGDILVDDVPTVSFSMEKTGSLENASFSFDDGKIYTGHTDGKLLDVLLGNESGSEKPTMLDALIGGWADDISGAIITYADTCGIKPRTASVDETIRAMGKAKKKVTYTIPAEDAPAIAGILAECASTREVGDWLSGLYFSGKQSLVFFKNSSGDVLQISYTGKCGADPDHLRNVTLRWRLRRDSKIRDDISLTSPAVTGTDKNTLTITRSLLDTDGVPTLECEWSHKSTLSKVTETTGGTISLTRNDTAEGPRIAGKITTTSIPSGSEITYKTEITPDITLINLADPDGGEDTLTCEGTVGYRYLKGKTVLEDAEISVSRYSPSLPRYDTLMEEIVLDGMGEAQLEELRQHISLSFTRDIVRKLVLLPKEGTLFISKDISDEAWENIVKHAE